MIPPGHVIVGGRKLAEMLTTTKLAEHVMVGSARIFGRGHDWQIVGEQIYSRAEVSTFLQSQAQNISGGLRFAENWTLNAVDNNPFLRGLDNAGHPRVYRIEYDGGRDWQNEFAEHCQAGWEHDYKAGMALARSVGYGLAGNQGAAMEEAVEAAGELLKGFCEKMEFMFGKS